ncbi:UPF0158 family protein [Opitutia bacterium ISCC 51]|nr:UPF0158 family protein [Opitutae bacterium ISCC 51]QXD28785.1 UPF0158 family protein [Opitutae bacterium ISCC 52]
MNDGFGDVSAYVSKSTGEVVYNDEPISDEPCPVEDIENNPDYIPIPTKHELDLGTQLVWQFVDKEIPALYPKVREIFSQKGAYGRFKDFLSYNGILEQWHEFETLQTRIALTEWCKENKIPLSLDNTSGE